MSLLCVLRRIDGVALRSEHGDLIDVRDEAPISVLSIDVVEEPLPLRVQVSGGQDHEKE